MFTDLAGYSALSQRDEALALQLLEEHRRMVRPLLGAHGGREIKTIGDAFLVEFASAVDAAACAVEIQRAHHTRNLTAPPERTIRMRIGLHAGDVIHREGDVYGDGVNIAARIEPFAENGGICLSEDVARPIANKLPGCALVRLGAGELKNITVPVDIYRLRLPWQKPRSALAERAAFFLAKKSVRRSLVAAAVAVAIVGAWWLRRPAGPEAPAPVKRLAVLPLVNLGGEARNDYFADGMTEELISSLSSVGELSIIARTSVVKFKDTKLDVAEIGRALGVGSILEGSVRMAGDQARINVTLVEVAGQRVLWTQEFNRNASDVFAVQSAIAMSVTEALKIRLLAILRRFPEAMAEFQRAQQLDPLSTSVSNGIGRVLHFERRYDEALAQFRRTLELDPQFPETHFNLGMTQLAMGRYADAIKTLGLALQLSHNRPVIAAMLGLAQGLGGRKEEARKLYEEMAARAESPYYLAIISLGLGEMDRAFRQLDEALAQHDGIMIYLGVEPDTAMISSDPRYAALLRRMGLPR